MKAEQPLADLRAALADLCAAVPPAHAEAVAGARARLDRLTKPQGSLGRIEDLIARLAGSTGQICPPVAQPAILLAAADHGVAAEGVSAFPQAVTAQMVQNYLAGGAAINALAAAAGARLLVVDAGVATELPEATGLRRLGIRRGSGNIAREPAMSEGEALRALLAGAALASELIDAGADLIALGEMGIANTTPAAALTSAFTGAPPARTVGRGTGIDDDGLARKRQVVELALERVDGGRWTVDGGRWTVDGGRWTVDERQAQNPPASVVSRQSSVVGRRSSVVEALMELGGLEIAVLAGATLAAAARRVPVLLDGYITTAAALVAAGLAPAARDHMLASHCSAEPGHALALAHLGLSEERGVGPLLRLELRLGEGSGAALALPLLRGAAQLMRSMATFDQAGVAEA